MIGLQLAYWQETILRIVIGLAALLGLTGAVVYLYLFKFVSFMQSRLGPMEAGPYGSLQLLAEVGKWLQKEDVFTERADRFVFAASPFVVILSTFMLFVVVPGGPGDEVAHMSNSLLYALAISAISVLGILMAGWSSANKYALLGGLRAAGQLVAYELPMILSEDIDVRQAVELFRSGCALRGVRRFPSVVAGGGMDVALLGTAIDGAGACDESARVERVVLGGFVPETVRTIIGATFPNASVFEHYSLAEVFGGASKAPGAGAFVSDAHVVAEVLDDEDAATPVGSIGELTLTELFPFVQVQPLIRYRTGDLVQRHRCDEPGRVAFRWWGRRSGSFQRADGAWILGEGPMIDALLGEPVVARSVHRGHLAVATSTIAMPVAQRVYDPLDGTALEIGVRCTPWMRNGDIDALLARLGQAVTPDARPGDLVLNLHRADDRRCGHVRDPPAPETARRVC